MSGHVPADVQYFIDCAIECCDIGGDVNNWFHYSLPDPAETFDIIERSVERDDTLSHGQSLMKTCSAFEQGYIRWLASNDPKDTQLTRWSGAFAIADQFKELFSTVTSPIVKPEQYDNHFFRHSTISCKTIDESLEKYSIAPKLEMLARVKKRWEPYKNDFSVSRYNQATAMIEFKRKKAFQQFVLDVKAGKVQCSERDFIDAEHLSSMVEEARNAKVVLPKKLIVAKRKTIKKSIILAKNVLPPNTINMFLKKESIIIEGNEYNFHLTKDNSSWSVAHGGVTTRVLDKNNVYLHNICVYSEDVPVLDHVVSLYLHIKSGLEQQIIDSGNKFTTDENGNRVFTSSHNNTISLFEKSTMKPLSQRDKNIGFKKVFKAFDEIIDVKRLLIGLPVWFNDGLLTT